MKTVHRPQVPMRLVLSAALLGALAPVAAKAGSAPDGAPSFAPYDFRYRISGHPRARPLQVFDDGQRTFFQFRPGAAVPVILAGDGPARQALAIEGPYHIVAGRGGHYTLLVSGGEAVVMHGDGVDMAKGGAASPALGPATARVPRDPADRTQSSYATPRRGDVIAWVESGHPAEYRVRFTSDGERPTRAAAQALGRLLRHAGRDARVEVQHPSPAPSRRLHAKRLRHLVEMLSSAGVSTRQIDLREGEGAAEAGDVWTVSWRASGEASPPASPRTPTVLVPTSSERVSRDAPHAGPGNLHGRPVAGNFDFLMIDRTVSVTLSRWAQDTGYRLDWKAPIDPPVTGELTLAAGAFPDAVARVVAGLRASGYPLTMDVPVDRTVRIRHDTGP